MRIYLCLTSNIYWNSEKKKKEKIQITYKQSGKLMFSFALEIQFHIIAFNSSVIAFSCLKYIKLIWITCKNIHYVDYEIEIIFSLYHVSLISRITAITYLKFKRAPYFKLKKICYLAIHESIMLFCAQF